MTEKLVNEAAGNGLTIDECLARAVVCRTLKLGLRRPDSQARRQLFSAGGKSALKRAAGVIGKEGAGEFTEAAASLVKLKAPALPLLKSCYDELFGHTSGGKVSPYETQYGSGHMFLQSKELADISGSFLAFGLQLDPYSGERVDHVAVEWEFLEFLCEKQAFALSRPDPEMVEVTFRAYRLFMRDHIARFGRAFSLSLVREKPDSFFGVLGKLAEGYITMECRRLGLPAGPDFLPLRPDAPDDGTPMACGETPELVQIDGTPDSNGHW